MTPLRQKNGRVVPSPEPLRVANPHAAGIDIHAAVHWVAVPPDHVPPKPAADGGAANPPACLLGYQKQCPGIRHGAVG